MRRLLNALAWVFAIFWLAFAGISMVYVITAGKSPDGPELFGYPFMAVTSDSMTPTIRSGDLVVGVPQKVEEIKIGDIVTYRNRAAGRLTTHRVKEITRVGSQLAFITQGDANDVTDGNPVHARDIIAVYSFHIPYAGYLVSFARGWTGLVFLIIIPSLILMTSEAIRLVRLVRLSKEQATVGPDKA